MIPEQDQIGLKHINMIKVLFFGKFRDITGMGEKYYNAKNLEELFEKVFDEFPLLKDNRYLVAVDGVMEKGNKNLAENQTVALLPPFAGG